MKKISFGLTLFLQMMTDKIKEECFKNAVFFLTSWCEEMLLLVSIKIL